MPAITRAEALLDEALAIAQQNNHAWSRSVGLVVRGVLETLRSKVIPCS